MTVGRRSVHARLEELEREAAAAREREAASCRASYWDRVSPALRLALLEAADLEDEATGTGLAFLEARLAERPELAAEAERLAAERDAG